MNSHLYFQLSILPDKLSKPLSNPKSQANAEIVDKKQCDLVLSYNLKVYLMTLKLKMCFMCQDVTVFYRLSCLFFENGEILGDKFTTFCLHAFKYHYHS